MTAEITGSIPDVVGSVLAVSEALRAGKGFVFNSCTFSIAIDAEDQKVRTPPSAASSSHDNKSNSASAASPAKRPDAGAVSVADGPTFFRVSIGSGGQGGPSTVVELGLRQIATPDRIIGIVELKDLDPAFDSSLDSVAVEITVAESSHHTAVLTIKGFANPGGSGYAHFMAAVVVSLTSGTTPRMKAEVKFASQAPPPQEGTGIFGKTVRVENRGERVQVHMETTPLFNR